MIGLRLGFGVSEVLVLGITLGKHCSRVSSGGSGSGSTSSGRVALVLSGGVQGWRTLQVQVP